MAYGLKASSCDPLMDILESSFMDVKYVGYNAISKI